MIETEYYILGELEFLEVKSDADELGLSIDYYLMEFCDTSDIIPNWFKGGTLKVSL